MRVSISEGRTGRTEIFIGDKRVSTKKVGREMEKFVEYHYRKVTGTKLSFMQITGASASTINIPKAAAPAVKESPFNINQRFSFVEKLVRMVASGVQPSAIITGEGGLGKTYTVNKTLKECGYVDVSATTPEEYHDLDTLDEEGNLKEFISIKGYSTPKALYRSLFDHNGKTIVFDDCDSVLKDQVAINLLKGALDSYDTRIISWYAEFPEKEYLPNSFEFTGKVIFISNMGQSKVDQAIRSRSMMIDLSMTLDQKIDRMEHISKQKDFLPEYTPKVKADAVEYIRELKHEAKEISLRTLISVAKIRSANRDWKDLAKYILVA